MNWSAPDGVSYNDATDEHGLDRTPMSTFPCEKKEKKSLSEFHLWIHTWYTFRHPPLRYISLLDILSKQNQMLLLTF